MLKVLITRPILDAIETEKILKKFCIGSLCLPLIEIKKISHEPILFSDYDVFIFTYHDQALIPFKIISNYEGVNFTSNLKIIRVSPSHGTAVDMIGKKEVNTKSIKNCFKILKKIYKNRNK